MNRRHIGYLLSISLLVFVGGINTEAQQLTKNYDHFRGTYNTEFLAPFIIANLKGDVILLKQKSKQTGDSAYKLTFKMKTAKEWWFFSYKDNGIELKIDNNTEQIYALSHKTGSKVIRVRSYDHVLHTWATITLEPEIVSLLRESRYATFKITFSDQGDYTWEVPSHILGTWKNIIDA